MRPERNVFIPLVVLTYLPHSPQTSDFNEGSILTEHVFIPLASGPYGIYRIPQNPQPSVKEVY